MQYWSRDYGINDFKHQLFEASNPSALKDQFKEQVILICFTLTDRSELFRFSSCYNKPNFSSSLTSAFSISELFTKP